MQSVDRTSQHQPKKPLTDIDDLRDILIDTAVLPSFIKPKLCFGHLPTPETLENIHIAMDAVVGSQALEARYKMSLEELRAKLDYKRCIEEGLRKYMHMEIDAYYKKAINHDPLLRYDISLNNDKRIQLVDKATQWLAYSYGINYPSMKVFNEANMLFNQSLKMYPPQP